MMGRLAGLNFGESASEDEMDVKVHEDRMRREFRALLSFPLFRDLAAMRIHLARPKLMANAIQTPRSFCTPLLRSIK